MSQAIEDKIISLSLEEDELESGATKALSTIDKLKQALKFDDAAQNLSALSDISKKADFSGIAEAVDNMEKSVGGKLSTLKLSLASALGNIASGLFGDLILNPIKQSITGGITRSQNIADAKFQLEGLGIAWEKIGDDINYAVDGTAYGLDEAAKAASQLSASSVSIGQDMKAALRGISGVAAMGNASYEDISRIFTKAAGNGRVMADELNRISAHGLNASAELAKFFNNIDKYNDEQVPLKVRNQIKELTKGLTVTEGDIRDFASHSKINFEMFAYAMDNAFGEHAKDANKTFSGALANMKSALNRIGEQFRAPIMDAAIPVFNGLRNMINGVKQILMDTNVFEVWSRILGKLSLTLTNTIEKITNFLTKDFTGASNIGKGLMNILYSIALVIETVGDAFRSVFGGESGGVAKTLNSAAEGFEKFTEKIIPSENALKAFGEILKKVFSAFKEFKFFGNSIAEFLAPYSKYLKLGTALLSIILGIHKGLSLIPGPIKIILAAVTAIFTVVKNFDRIKEGIQGLISRSTLLSSILKTITPILTSIGDKVKAVLSTFGNNALAAIFTGIAFLVEKFKALMALDLNGLKNKFVGIKDKIVEFIEKAKEIPVIGELFNNVQYAVEKVANFIISLKNKFVEFFTSITGGSRTMSRSVTSDMSVVQKVFAGIATVLGGAVLAVVAALNKAFSALKAINISLITDKLQEFVNSIKKFGLLETISTGLRSFGEKIAQAFSIIVEKIREFIEGIKENGSVMDFVMEKLQALIAKLIAVKDKMVEIFSGGDVTRSATKGSFSQAMDVIRDKFTVLKDYFIQGMAYIRENGLLTKTLMIAYVLAILKALMSFSKGADQVTSSMGSLGKMFNSIGGAFWVKVKSGLFGNEETVSVFKYFFDNLSESINSFTHKSKAEEFSEVVKSLAISFAVLAAALAILTKVADPNQLERTALIFGTLSVILIGVTGLMSILHDKAATDAKPLHAFSFTLIALAAAVGTLAIVLGILTRITWETAVPAIIALIGCVGVMYLLIRAIDKIDTSGTTLKGVLFLTSLALVLRSLAKSLVDFSKSAASFENMTPKALLVLVAMIGAFAVLCLAAGQVNLSGALAAVVILIVFKKFMEALAEFAQTDYSTIIRYLYEARQDIVTCIIAVTLILAAARVFLKVLTVEIIKLTGEIGKNIALAGAGILMMAVGILVLVAAIKKISKLQIDGEGAAKVVLGLFVVVSMMVALGLLAKHMKEGSKGFVAIAAAFALLSFAAIQIALTALLLKKVEWDTLWKALTIMLAITVLMGLLVAAAKYNNNNVGMKSLIAIVAGMALMIGELMLLSVLVSNPATFENLKKALLILLAMMGSYAAVLGYAGTIDGTATKALIAIILSMGLIFAALYFLSTQVSSWSEVGQLAAVAAIMAGTVIALLLTAKSFLRFAKESNAGQGKWVLKSLAMFGIMIGAFVVVAGTLLAATKLGDYKQMAVMALTLAAAVVGLAFAAKLIIDSMKNVQWKRLAKAAASLGVMIVAMAAIAAIIIALDRFQSGGMTRAGGSTNAITSTLIPVLLTMEALALILKQIGSISTSGIFKGIAALLAMTGIFAVLAVIIGLLNNFGGDAGGMIAKSQIVVLVLAEFVIILTVLGAISGLVSMAYAALPALVVLTVIFGVLALIAGLLNQFGGDAKGMIAKTQIVALVLVELVAILALLGLAAPLATLAYAAIPALTVLTIIFGILALIAALLNNFGGAAKDMLAKTQVVSLVLVELVGILALLGLIAPLGAAAIASLPGLLGVVAAMGILALVMAAINMLDISDMDTQMNTLTSILWKLVGIVAVLGLLSVGAVGELAGAAAILMVCAALIPLSQAIRNMQDLDFDKVGMGLQVLAKGLTLVMVAGAVGAVVGLGLITLAVGIAAVGAACVVAAVGATAFSVALTLLVATLSTVGGHMVQAAKGAVEGFKQKFEELKKLPGDIVDAVVKGVKAKVSDFKQAAKDLAKGFMDSFRDAVGWHSPVQFLIQFFDECGVTVNHEAEHVSEIFEGTGETWGSALTTALGNKISNFDISSIGSALGIDFGSAIFNGAAPGIGSIQTMLNSLGFNINLKQVQMSKLNQQWKSGQLTLKEYTEKMGEVEKEYSSTTDAGNGLTDMLDGLGDAFTTTGSKASSGASGVKDFRDTLTSTLEGQMSIFSKFEEKTAMSKEELINNMKSQITGMTNWANQMDKLATMGIDEGLYQKLAEMGPQGAEYVGAFVSMTADELGMANELWAESLVLPGAVANQISVNMKDIGVNTLVGYQNGLDAETNNTLAKLGVIAEDGVETFAEGMGTHSPSWKFHNIGAWCMQGLRRGMENNASLVFFEMNFISDHTYALAHTGFAPGKYTEFGRNICEGILSGINESKQSIFDALEEIASKTEEVTKKALKVNSPSKLFIPIGSAIPEGMAVGIERGFSFIDDSLNTVADRAVESMKYTIASIATTVQDGIEDPVITPVLDLSKVQAGVRTLNSSFSASQASIAAGSIANLQNGQYAGQNGTTFIQNNYSPKALSRIEIYRDTRNLFAQAKGALS